MKKLILAGLFVLFLFTANARGATYYVSAIGADTNNGTTKTTSWLHAPGMTNCASTCSSTTIHAGDSVIFRGGDTWHFGQNIAPYVGAKAGWTWTVSGTSGNQIYVGVDQTWFTGGSWTRPIMTGDNPLWNGTTWPTSCTNDFGTANQSVELGASFITFDNFEITGFCLTGSNGFTFFDRDQSTARHGLILSNMYAHGWTMTAATVANFSFYTSLGNIPGGVEQSDVIGPGNTVDGFDSPHFPTGSNCTASADPCASGQAVYGWAWDVHGNVFRYVANVAVTLNTSLWHDNLTEYLETAWSTAAVNNQHSNILNNLGGASGENMYFYNNIMRHTFVTEDVYFGVRTNIYIFNNVMYDNMNNSVFAPGPGPGACIRLNKVSNSATLVTAFIYGNTDDSSCQFKFEVANTPLTRWSGTGNFQNNHWIGWSPATLSSVYICATGGTCTINDNGGELFQTTAVANGQGYTTSNNYAPTSSSGSTVTTAGGNLTSSCSTFSPDSALCSGTTGAASESGGIITFPSIPIVPRPSSGAWNVGAYQFSTTPVSGASLSPTSIAFPNQIITTTSGALSTTLTNTGGATLNISSIALTGTNAADFTISSNTCSSTLAAGSNCVVSATFTPSVASARSASITFTDDAATSPQNVTLTGTGVNAIPPPTPHRPVVIGLAPNGCQVGMVCTLTAIASADTPPLSWSANFTIPGLALGASTGSWAGTPTTAATYSGNLTVKDSYVCGKSDPAGCSNTSVAFPVSIVVSGSTSKYVLEPTPTLFSFGSSTTQNLTVDDTTPGPLPFTMSSDSPWLSFCVTHATTKTCGTSSTSGTSSTLATGTVTTSVTGLAAGTYIGHLTIKAGTGISGATVNNTPFVIPVTLTVAPPPASATMKCLGGVYLVCTLVPVNIPSGTSVTGTVSVDGLTIPLSGVIP